MTDFDPIWESGPWRKLGRAEAARRFQESVRTPEDLADLLAAVDAYKDYCRANTWYTPMMGSVFFGSRKGWKNWIPEKVPEEGGLFKEPKLNHICLFCDIGAHPHQCPECDGDTCNNSYELACQYILKNLREGEI